MKIYLFLIFVIFIGCSKQEKNTELDGKITQNTKVYNPDEPIELFDLISLILPDENSSDEKLNLSKIFEYRLFKKVGFDNFINIKINENTDKNHWKIYSKDDNKDSLSFDRVIIGFSNSGKGSNIDCIKYSSLDSLFKNKDFRSVTLKWQDCSKALSENLFEVAIPNKKTVLVSLKYDGSWWLKEWATQHYYEITLMLKPK